jgi:hypothetical protein
MCTDRGGPDRGPTPVVSCRISNPDASDHPHLSQEAQKGQYEYTAPKFYEYLVRRPARQRR